MKNILGLVVFGLLIASCSDDSGSANQAPSGMAGVWIEEASAQAVQTAAINPVAPVDCNDVTFGNQGVTTALVKVSPDGIVYDAQNVTNGQTYRVLGSVNSAGIFVPNADGKAKFGNTFFDGINAPGVSIVTSIFMRTEDQVLKGKVLIVSSKTTFSSQGASQEFPGTESTFIQTTEDVEKAVINKAKTCYQQKVGANAP